MPIEATLLSASVPSHLIDLIKRASSTPKSKQDLSGLGKYRGAAELIKVTRPRVNSPRLDALKGTSQSAGRPLICFQTSTLGRTESAAARRRLSLEIQWITMETSWWHT